MQEIVTCDRSRVRQLKENGYSVTAASVSGKTYYWASKW